MEIVSSSSVFLNPSYVLLQVRVSIRKAMREEQLILVMLKCVSESKCIEGAQELVIISFIWTRMIIDVLTDAMPAYSFSLFDLVREAQYLHAVVIKRIWLS